MTGTRYAADIVNRLRTVMYYSKSSFYILFGTEFAYSTSDNGSHLSGLFFAFCPELAIFRANSLVQSEGF